MTTRAAESRPNGLQDQQRSSANHDAFKVTQSTFDEINRRLVTADISRRHANHGYAKSIYVLNPDKLKVEFTFDPANVEEINAARRADAHTQLDRWLKGDHTPNKKIGIEFGAGCRHPLGRSGDPW